MTSRKDMLPESAEARRKVASVLVYYCAECEWYFDADGGNECPGEEHERSGLMRRRRGYICPDCDPDGDFYLTRKDFLEHNHNEY